jgi:hypothetical protein
MTQFSIINERIDWRREVKRHDGAAVERFSGRLCKRLILRFHRRASTTTKKWNEVSLRCTRSITIIALPQAYYA